MWVFRAYLLAGLLAHKAIWELLKRKGPEEKREVPFSVLLVKGLKVTLLLGILVQTAVPVELLPISAQPQNLRVAGILLYTLGLLTAILGRLQLGSSWSDIETPRAAEKLPVVSRGIYSYIRHPIYTGDLLMLLGLELALNSWFVLGIVALAPMVLRFAVKEEKMLADRLSGYGDYVQRTKRFIPFVV